MTFPSKHWLPSSGGNTGDVGSDISLLLFLTFSSNVAVSNLIPLSVDTVAVGLVSSVVVYPVYLVILFLFRMARSKVTGKKNH